MFFSIKNDTKVSSDKLKSVIINEARRRILFYPLGVNEKQLNKYMKEKYDMNLRQACGYLALNINFTTDSLNNIILNFITKEQNKLATLITYGTGTIPGSKILQFAFNQLGG